MAIISKISKLLANDQIQRICYFIALIIWFLLCADDYRFYFAESSVGIKYIWLVSLPAVLLIIQIIVNKTIVWAIILGLTSLFTVYSVYGVFTHDDSVKEIYWDFYDGLFLTIYFLIWVVIIWIIYKLKPTNKRKLCSKN